MKRVIALAGFLVLGSAHAEVFKCQQPNGSVEYQASPCASGPSVQVQIEPSDPEKIKAAQAQLTESLKQQAERDAAAADAEQKERAVAAQEAIANGMSNQTNAQESTPQAVPIYPYYVAPYPVADRRERVREDDRTIVNHPRR